VFPLQNSFWYFFFFKKKNLIIINCTINQKSRKLQSLVSFVGSIFFFKKKEKKRVDQLINPGYPSLFIYFCRILENKMKKKRPQAYV
jgi:hypothetical protein